jgi:hypothetical protein
MRPGGGHARRRSAPDAAMAAVALVRTRGPRRDQGRLISRHSHRSSRRHHRSSQPIRLQTASFHSSSVTPRRRRDRATAPIRHGQGAPCRLPSGSSKMTVRSSGASVTATPGRPMRASSWFRSTRGDCAGDINAREVALLPAPRGRRRPPLRPSELTISDGFADDRLAWVPITARSLPSRLHSFLRRSGDSPGPSYATSTIAS